MNDIYEKSLALMTEFLDNISDEEFLSTYNALERNVGPTVEDYLNPNLED
jgi:hypothetical protein